MADADHCFLCAPPGSEKRYRPPDRDHHPECGLREVLGGIGHLIDHRRWCIEGNDPDMGLTYRQSARKVWDWVHENGIEAAAAIDAREGR